jgi:hypothetical protein
VQVVELDRVRSQAAEAVFDLPTKHVGPALARPEAALGRDDAVVGRGRKGGSDRLLALPTGVEMGSVDQADSGCDRLPDELDVLRRQGEPVRPEPDAGDLGVAQRQRSRGHVRDSAWSWWQATTVSSSGCSSRESRWNTLRALRILRLRDEV